MSTQPETIAITWRNDNGPLTAEQRKHIFAAEDELAAAGFTFGTGYDLVAGERDWFLPATVSARVASNPERESDDARAARVAEIESIEDAVSLRATDPALDYGGSGDVC